MKTRVVALFPIEGTSLGTVEIPENVQAFMRERESREFYLPECLRKALEYLFEDAFKDETLDWGSIKFYYGLPVPQYWNRSGIGAHTRPVGKNIHIYVDTDRSLLLCEERDFIMLAHEMIHALQIRKNSGSIGTFHSCSAKYLGGWLEKGFWDLHENHPMEIEAEEFESRLKKCLDSFSGNPCNCGSVPLTSNPDWYKNVNTQPKCSEIRNPDVSGGEYPMLGFFAIGITLPLLLMAQLFPNLFAGPAAWIMAFGLALVVLALSLLLGLVFASLGKALEKIGIPRELVNTMGWTANGAIVGGTMFGPIGAAIGALIGAVLGLIDTYSKLLSGIISWFANALAAILGPIAEFIFGKGPRIVWLKASIDDGQSWEFLTPVTVSAEPPAVLASTGDIFILTTQEDNSMSMIVAPNSGHTFLLTMPTNEELGIGRLVGEDLLGLEYIADDSGPSLAYDAANDILYIVWQHEDNKLACRAWASISNVPNEYDPRFNHVLANLSDRNMVGATVHDDNSPGSVFGNGRVYVAWIRKNHDNIIGIKSSADNGETWREEVEFVRTSPVDFAVGDNHGTPALAYGEFADTGGVVQKRMLYLSYVGKETQRVYVMWFEVLDDGKLNHLPPWSDWFDVGWHSADKAGPALVFGNNQLFLSFVHTDDNNLFLARYDLEPVHHQLTGVPIKEGAFIRNLGNKARDNAGPSLAYRESGTHDPGLLLIAFVED